jgi:hypothetical protein
MLGNDFISFIKEIDLNTNDINSFQMSFGQKFSNKLQFKLYSVRPTSIASSQDDVNTKDNQELKGNPNNEKVHQLEPIGSSLNEGKKFKTVKTQLDQEPIQLRDSFKEVREKSFSDSERKNTGKYVHKFKKLIPVKLIYFVKKIYSYLIFWR